MGARYLTDLAAVCRAAGLAVFEVDGWQTRARSSGGYDGDRPWAIVWHHTASDTSPANDVAYIVAGSPDAPISNLYLARDGSVHVCAAGACNHAGKGGPAVMSAGTVPADQMNTHSIGIEAASDGVGGPWSVAQIDAYFTLSNALAAAYGMLPTDAITHNAWAPTRKIDPATAAAVQGPWRPAAVTSSGTWSLDDIRAEAVRRSRPPAPPENGDLMFKMFDMLGNTYGGYFDLHGIAAQVTWLSPSRMAACAAAGAPHIGELSPDDLANCDLLGPLPAGTDPAIFANVIG